MDANCGMTLRQPAMRWQDACPVGNGSLGAMPYGHIRHEQILLNHEALWRRQPKPDLADVSDLRTRLNALLKQGQYEQAQSLLPDALVERGGAGRRPDAFLPLGWLRIDVTAPAGVFTQYRRGIDFTNGETWTRWQMGTEKLRRRCFVSRADRVMVMEQSSEGGSRLDAALWFAAEDRFGQAGLQHAKATVKNVMGSGGQSDTDPFHLPVTVSGGNDGEFFWMNGEVDTGVTYGMVGRVIAPGGTMVDSGQPGRLCVQAAERLLVLVRAYVDEPAEEALPRLRRNLAALPADYDRLLQNHAPQHAELFNRCRLTLADGDDGRQPNEDLLAQAYDGEVPDALLERMHHFGRHLLICSSGRLPANLQGIWNGDYSPAWSCDYHNDENIQMSYWLAGSGKLPELLLPLIDYYSSFMADYRENARKLHGAGGILLPIVQTTHALSYATVWVYWTAAAGWLAQHFYDYFAFTGDRDTLRSRILPWLEGCLQFYESFLQQDASGKLAFVPSLSPENVPDRPDARMVTRNATMDVAVCREVLTHLREACHELGDRPELIERSETILDNLPDYQTNADGAIREWLPDEFPDNYHHRHQSHLYPVFPGLEVTQESQPELLEACRIAVDKRLTLGLTSQTGWSMVHMANTYARLGDGDRACECLELLSRAETGPNLLTYHNDWRGMGLSMPWLASPPFQIDANLGMAAAVLEMLVISTPDCLRLLPGLPTRWPRGRVGHIACRGALTVALQWDRPAGRVIAELHKQTSGTITIRLPWPIIDVRCVDPDVTIGESQWGECYRTVILPAKRSRRITLSVRA